MNDLISVIVSTYNWPTALDLVLQSLALQKDNHFEVIVADEGYVSTSLNPFLAGRQRVSLGTLPKQSGHPRARGLPHLHGRRLSRSPRIRNSAPPSGTGTLCRCRTTHSAFKSLHASVVSATAARLDESSFNRH